MVMQTLVRCEMETKTVRDLELGEFFKRKPESKKVYVRDKYIQISKRFACNAFEDMNVIMYLKPDTVVYVGFTF